MSKEERPLRYGWAFWGAVVITVVLWMIPVVGGLLTYPFTILATWAHEMGHGITALLVGGDFHQLKLYADGSGLAYTAVPPGARQAAVSAGGLLGAPILGSLIVVLSSRQRFASPILWVLAAALLVSAAIWVRSVFGWVAVLVLGAGLALAALKLSGRRRFLLVQLLGVQIALSVWRGSGYLFTGTATIGGEQMPSDVATIANAVGGNWLFWGLQIAALDILLLFAAYKLVSRRLARDEAW